MTPAAFKAAFPAFVNELDATIQRHLDAAPPWFDEGRWGAFYPAGLGYFVAHFMETERLDRLGGAGGAGPIPAIRKQVGSVSVEYSSHVADKVLDDFFMGTRYGQRYRFLAKQVGFGALAV